MKKFLAILLALTMVLCLFACGEKEPEAENNGGEEVVNNGGEENNGAAAISGETYNAGNFSALVPEGWKAFPVSDMWSDDADAVDPNSLQICKGGESEWDLFSKPYIDIDYYGPENSMMTPSSEWYEEVVELEPIVAGDYTWNGFTCVSGTPLAILWMEDGDHQYQANIWMQPGDDGAVNITDADLLAILASVTPAA